VDPDSGFRRLGLREGDVLVALGSERLDGADDAQRLIDFLRSGQRGLLFVERDGQMGRVEVRLPHHLPRASHSPCPARQGTRDVAPGRSPAVATDRLSASTSCSSAGSPTRGAY
jgi:hypothetical protein